MKCYDCQAETDFKLIDYELEMQDGRSIILQSLPGYICPQCGERYLTKDAMITIEDTEKRLKSDISFTNNILAEIHNLTKIGHNYNKVQKYEEIHSLPIFTHVSSIIEDLNSKIKLGFREIIYMILYFYSVEFNINVSKNTVNEILKNYYPRPHETYDRMYKKMRKIDDIYFKGEDLVNLTDRGITMAELIIFNFLEEYQTELYLDLD